VPIVDGNHLDYQEIYYSDPLQLNITADGEIVWEAARSKTPPTSCFTAGHTINAGYTPSGKFKPPKFVPGKTDRRAGK
jgi:hypothetical protein